MALFPRRFGSYELLGEVARGASGIVYKASHPGGGEPVALKVLREEMPSIAADERFHREAQVAARLKHPNIVPVLDAGEVDRRFFFTMPLIEGRSLSEILFVDHPTSQQVARLVEKIARAMHYAHEQGVIHRDLKPTNILVGPDGEPMITDFGIARDQKRRTLLTAYGELLGTPSYMAPEQILGKANQADARTDVYALGSILYLALAKRPPFEATNFVELSACVLQLDPEPPSRFNPDVNPSLERICMRCLRKNPADRYPSALAMADDLARFKAPAPPPLPEPRSRNSIVLWVGLLAAIGSGCLLLRGVEASSAPDGMVEVAGFWIDRCEVSFSDYSRFIEESGYRPPTSWRNKRPPRGQEYRPITGVTFEDAEAYARWAGKRLPTIDEWRKAARGVGRLTSDQIVCAEGSLDVGSRDVGVAEDISDCGALNMAGNVAEWTSSVGSVGERMRIACGGHWKAPAKVCRDPQEEELAIETREPTLGFRCAKSK